MSFNEVMLDCSGLTLVEICETYNVHADRDGEYVYLQHRTCRVLVAFNDIDIRAAWSEWNTPAEPAGFHDWLRERTYEPGYVDIRAAWSEWNTPGQTVPFHDWLRERTYEPDDVDQIAFCADCDDPEHEDDLYSTNDEHGSVCDSCIDNYWSCHHCDERYGSTTTVGVVEVCGSCLDDHYSWCEDCEAYYYSWDGGGCGGEHEGCDCESPAQSFRVRNDGLDPLVNDSRVTITLPAGVISEEGIGEISRLIRMHADQVFYASDQTNDESIQAARAVQSRWRTLAKDLAVLGDRWQAKEGNFTKRLSRHAYKNHQLKVPPEVISAVGNIASDHSRAVNFDIEVTRDLNLSAEDFGHEDSCWWQSYYHGRCALKSNGGFGIRTFDEHGYVTGRAWVLPLRLTGDPTEVAERSPGAITGCTCLGCVPPSVTRSLAPTFETERADAFVVFNGYGNLSGYTPARILSHMAGMTYRKIGFRCEPMYVNAESGYLIAAEDLAQRYTDGSLNLSVDQHSDLHETEQSQIIESKELAHA